MIVNISVSLFFDLENEPSSLLEKDELGKKF